MKIALLILGVATLLGGCVTRTERVVYEEPRGTVIRERAGSRVYVTEPDVRVYPYSRYDRYDYSRPMHPPKLSQYHTHER